MPIGAEVQPSGAVHFRVWAPNSRSVGVELVSDEETGQSHPLDAEGTGYFSGVVSEARAGSLYRFRLDHGSFPDPASRFQPSGPHGPSQVVDPAKFHWTDHAWKGRPPREAVIYEMHIGTFTSEGTWGAASQQLPALRDLGVTFLEVMPVAEFPGRFGWGYDGVDLFAPTRLYGTPDEVGAFVNRAHELGMMVLLDVVYNHVGPDGNYLKEYSPHYFSTKYTCEWGEPLNFDGEKSAPVREFFLSNARYWIEEFHFDGLRLDATQQIFDASERHILAEITHTCRQAGNGRHIYLVGENEPQETRLVRSIEAQGCGLDSLWNDDFHHTAKVAATGSREAYYFDYKGTPQEFISSAKYGYLYQGQYYAWQKKRRGTPAFDLSPLNFVVFLENHDQIANSLHGRRLHQLAAPGQWRALTALTLLHPGTPMLFQGDEFAACAPFHYFADHHPELNALVRKGRAEFSCQFRSTATPEAHPVLRDPGAVETFARCKLDHQERTKNAPVYKMHQDLLSLRREDATLHEAESIDGAVLGEHALVLRYFSSKGDDRLLLVNLGPDLYLSPAPEPLLSPREGGGWRVIWSSENPAYGGRGTPPLETQAGWILPANAAIVLKPDENSELPGARLSQED